MPCRSDYLDPTYREQELQRAAILLEFVYIKLEQNVTENLKKAASDIYCSADYVPELCEAIKHMTAEQKEKIIYNARSATSRDLANWWEDHKKADRKRLAEERKEEREKELADKAKSKLTKAELNALKKYI